MNPNPAEDGKTHINVYSKGATELGRLRTLAGFAAKQLGRQLRGKDWVADDMFKTRILTAISAKIAAHPRIRELLKQSTLPLIHYYVFNGRVFDETTRCRWMLDHFESIRQRATLTANT